MLYLVGLLRASREGNWLLYLSAIDYFISSCFAYDKMNYARYLPIYFAEMTALPQTHPNIFENFLNGQFSVQMSNNNTFGRIPVDQTIECTINKDTQTAGGTTTISSS